MGTLTTSAEEVRRLFGCTRAAVSKFEEWLVDERRQAVVPVVLAHLTRVPYLLQPDDVREVCARSSHALGEVDFKTIKHVKDAHDWSPAFSFSHLFHYLMEEVGTMPTWDEFVAFYLRDREGRHMLGDEVDRRYRELVAEGEEEEVAWDALHWRVGNAYYGIVRDIFTVVQLRDRGFDVRCHSLADTLFRADAWVGRTIVSLLVKNRLYRDATHGRKTKPQELYADAEPGFSYENVELEAADKFGRVHLPSDDAISALVERISSRNDDFHI